MEMLIFGTILIFMFVGVPFLLPWVVVKLTKRDDDEAPAEPRPSVAYPSSTTSPAPRPVPTEEFMKNPFRPPAAQVDDVVPDHWNNSGGGGSAVPPKGVKGWSWGAFMLNWVWALFNRTWIGLLCLVPYVGFILCIYLGVKGRELAWQNKRWDSLEHFNRVQRRWSVAAGALVLGGAGIGILAAILIPALQR